MKSTYIMAIEIIFKYKLNRMLRQKRFSITKQTLKLPKAMNAWSNDENISIFQVTNSKWHCSQSNKQVQKRNELTQISNQNSLLLFKPQVKSSQRIDTNEEYRESLMNSKQIVVTRLTQIVQSQALILPQNLCSSEIKPIWQGARSKTAESHQSRGSKWGQAIVNRCNFVLNVSRPSENNQDRISMSRALINHATVKKNSAEKKFFMRKDKKMQVAFFSARKMILQNNQRKNSKERTCKQIQKSFSMKETKGKKALRISQKRYGHHQQFDLKGWDNDSLQYD